MKRGSEFIVHILRRQFMSEKVLSVFLALVFMIPSFASAEIAEPSSLKEILQERAVQNAERIVISSKWKA